MSATPHVYQVGYKLGAFRDLTRPPFKVHGANKRFKRLEQMLATVSVTSSGRVAANGASPSDDGAFIGSILRGVLQRGISPLIAADTERELLQLVEDAKVIDLEDSPQPTDVGYKLAVEENECEALLDRICASHVLIDDQATPEWSSQFDSEAERCFYFGHLRELLGRGIHLVEAQRPLQTMLVEDTIDYSRFSGQRVDFALETPTGTKIAFEVDGPQHQNDRAFDQNRDCALYNAGWHVERIPTSNLRPRAPFSPEVHSRVERDATLAFLRDSTLEGLCFTDPVPQIILRSHGVARIQLAILLAMIEGSLAWDAPRWTIGVIERDGPCAALALRDLVRQTRNLSAIYELNSSPTVDLHTFSDYGNVRHVPVADTEEGLEVHDRSLGDLHRDVHKLDLLIDCSVRLRPMDRLDSDQSVRAALESAPRAFILRTAYRRSPEAPPNWPAPRSAPHAQGHKAELEYFLRHIFRKPGFREKQLEIIARAMSRQGVIGLLPTGGGKSVTFQLPTLLSPGAAIVIAPLRSLMDDQADNLHRIGINRHAVVHGGQARHKKEANLRSIGKGYPRLIYVAPERFHISSFRDELAASPISRSISFVVVDEAHCVSEWGHDFRPSYLHVARTARRLCTSSWGPAPILALTGTASSTVLLDIQRELDFDQNDPAAIVATSTFRRKELNFLPIVTDPATKTQGIWSALDDIATNLELPRESLLDTSDVGGLVFCRHVNGHFGIDKIKTAIITHEKVDTRKIQMFAGGRPRSFQGTDTDWNEHKSNTQRAYKDNAFSLLVATSSFGMGIDKPNIRYTIHYGIPNSVEALAQEAGRAGRDRKAAYCAVVFTDDTSVEGEVEAAIDDLPTHLEGDASRVRWLLNQNFPGAKEDALATDKVLHFIRNKWNKHGIPIGKHLSVRISSKTIAINDDDMAKAIYRLTVLGVIHDYTRDYPRKWFDVDTIHIAPDTALDRLGSYVRRYDTEERVQAVRQEAHTYRQGLPVDFEHIIRAFTEFVYDVIAKSREQAIENIVRMMRSCGSDGQKLGSEISTFLSNNEFTSAVSEMATASTLDQDTWWALIDRATSGELIGYLLVTCRRELESSPNHPGLHLLVALSLLQGTKPDIPDIGQSVITALETLRVSYDVTVAEQTSIANHLVDCVRRKTPARFEALTRHVVIERRNELFARAAYPYVTDLNLRRECAVPWISDVSRTAQHFRLSTTGA